MSVEHAKEAALWTLALVCIAITIAAGTRIVAWLMQGETTHVWRAAIALIAAASGGGIAAAAIRRRSGE